jgi:D-threo-aldose 1-dehydrogenase
MTEDGRSLQSRPLGNTGLLVSPLCFGTAPLGDMPDTFGFSVSKERAHKTLRAAPSGVR